MLTSVPETDLANKKFWFAIDGDLISGSGAPGNVKFAKKDIEEDAELVRARRAIAVLTVGDLEEEISRLQVLLTKAFGTCLSIETACISDENIDETHVAFLNATNTYLSSLSSVDLCERLIEERATTLAARKCISLLNEKHANIETQEEFEAIGSEYTLFGETLNRNAILINEEAERFKQQKALVGIKSKAESRSTDVRLDACSDAEDSLIEIAVTTPAKTEATKLMSELIYLYLTSSEIRGGNEDYSDDVAGFREINNLYVRTKQRLMAVHISDIQSRIPALWTAYSWSMSGVERDEKKSAIARRKLNSFLGMLIK